MYYLMRRAGHGLLLLFAVSILTFLLTQLAPGEYFDEMRLNPQISPQTIASIRTRYGVDQPLPLRYFHWLKSASRGDFGFSFAYNSPVSALLWPRIGHTLILTLPVTLLAWILAILIGVWSAAHRGGWIDRIAGTGTSSLLAIPDLMLALALLLFAVRTGYFPAGGMISVGFDDLSPWNKLKDLAWHMFLPGAALVLSILPMLIRHVRSSMNDVLDAPFIRTALANGIPPHRILWRHAFPAAVNPLISLFGISIGTLLSSSLLIEVVMSWPGLGPLLLEAILARDMYLVIGAILCTTAFLAAGNLCADIMLYAADPRIRREKA